MVKAKYIVCGVSDEGTVIMGLSSDEVEEKYLNLKIIHQKEIEKDKKQKTKFEKYIKRFWKKR